MTGAKEEKKEKRGWHHEIHDTPKKTAQGDWLQIALQNGLTYTTRAAERKYSIR